MPSAEPAKIKWACPKCGAESGKHGKGGRETCMDTGGTCTGFVCECGDYENAPEHTNDRDHGESLVKACPLANCYHCGWGGKFPTKAHLAKKNLIPCPHCKGTGLVKDKA